MSRLCHSRGYWFVWVGAFAVAALHAQDPVAPTLQIVDAGSSLVAMPASSPLELSGLAWAGAKRYYAVSDSDPRLHPFDIDVDPADGHIVSVTRQDPIRLVDVQGRPSRGSDLEGVAYDADRQRVLVGDEEGLRSPLTSILMYQMPAGRQVGALDLTGTWFTPRAVRSGLGLESLATRGSAVWTSNEEALVDDGPSSSSERGSVVRLTRFDDGRLAGQWAYRVEASGGAMPYAGQASGVVDLAVLPDGRLLVLERATVARRGPADFGGFLSRVYLADVTGATDVQGVPGLGRLSEGREYVPVAKRLLWSRYFTLLSGVNNFEGMALGRDLGNGRRSLLLISDNDRLPSTLWALRVEGL